MAALAMLPPPPDYARIVLPGDGEDGLVGSVHECLAQAAQWLDAARAFTIEQAATPPTSLHVVAGRGT
jgi:hypothetical protein